MSTRLHMVIILYYMLISNHCTKKNKSPLIVSTDSHSLTTARADAISPAPTPADPFNHLRVPLGWFCCAIAFCDCRRPLQTTELPTQGAGSGVCIPSGVALSQQLMVQDSESPAFPCQVKRALRLKLPWPESHFTPLLLQCFPHCFPGPPGRTSLMHYHEFSSQRQPLGNLP